MELDASDLNLSNFILRQSSFSVLAVSNLVFFLLLMFSRLFLYVENYLD